MTSTSQAPTTPSEEPVPAPAAIPHTVRRQLTQGRVAGVIELLAVIPVIATIIEVWRAPRLNFLDYWWVLRWMTHADGSFSPLGMLRLQNEHFLGIPSVLYWIDATVFGGDQRFLGYVTVAVTLGSVFLVRSALPATLSPVLRASIVLGVSFTAFSLHGLHYFSRGMSGVAWLTTNMLVIAALLLAFRGRWAPALGAALLASVTYGTAFAAWPVLIGIGLVTKQSRRRIITTVVAGAAVAGIWLLMLLHSATGGLAEGTVPANDLGSLIFRYLTLYGHLWTGDNTTIAALAGAAMLVGYAVLFTIRSARRRHLWFWWSLGVFSILSCGLVALARLDFGSSAGLWSRYTSVSIMGTIPLVVLTASVLGERLHTHQHRIAIAVGAAGVLVFSLGAISAMQVRSENNMHELQAIGIRIGLPNAYTTLDWPIPDAPDLVPRLQALHHYPFNDSFSLNCGGPELGSTLDARQYLNVVSTNGAQGDWWTTPSGQVQSVKAREGGARLISGWVGHGTNLKIRCVTVVDKANKIIGAGVIDQNPNIPPPRNTLTGNYGFTAIAPANAATVVVVGDIDDKSEMLALPITQPPK